MRCLPGYGYGLTFLFLVCPINEYIPTFIMKSGELLLILPFPLLLLPEHRSQ